MMRVSGLKGKRVNVRQVNPGELTGLQRRRVDDARLRAEAMRAGGARLIEAAGCDRAGFEHLARWYVARCRAGQEMRIAAELKDAGIEAWCPTEEKRKRSRRGMDMVVYPVAIFHSYVFVRLMPWAEAWIGCLMASRLSGYVGRDGQPHAVSDELVKLLKLNAEKVVKDKEELSYKKRQTVNVWHATTGDIVAVIRSIIPTKRLAKVQAEINGLKTLLTIDIDQIIGPA